jgi:penicillin amidase
MLALDNVIADIGLGPYNEPRPEIIYGHAVLAGLLDPLLGTSFGDMHRAPWSSRSTYAQVVELGENGPVRIESMFPLGTSGQLWFNGTFVPETDPNFATMAPAYDPFMPRPFPLFD